MLMLFLTALFTVGMLLAKKGWKREPRWKNKLFVWGVGMMTLALTALLLIIIVNIAIFGIKIVVGAIAGFFALLWGLKWVLLCGGIVILFIWLKSKLNWWEA